MVVTPPAMLMRLEELRISPSAMVPSWQLRQSIDAPVGWPGVANAVELVYGV